MARTPVWGIVASLVCVSVLIIGGFYRLSTQSFSYPSESGPLVWEALETTDKEMGGNSSMRLRESGSLLDFEFKLSDTIEFPYASVYIRFSEQGQEVMPDWSNYTHLSFRVSCQPDNVLAVSVLGYDEQFTKLEEFSSFRPLQVFVSCSADWQNFSLDLRQLDTPEWWLVDNKLPVSAKGYTLDKIKALAFVSTRQSPVGIETRGKLEDITLAGRNWLLMSSGIGLVVLLWGAALLFWWRLRAIQLAQRHELGKNSEHLKVVPCEKIEVREKGGKDQDAVLAYLAQEYSNANLNLDTVVNTLGLNRTKLNQVLKDSTGMTFVAYLNKLRLSEAARLLSEKDSNISEIAYAVGYNSVSYFNRLFKQEYGVSPTLYKQKKDAVNTP